MGGVSVMRSLEEDDIQRRAASHFTHKRVSHSQPAKCAGLDPQPLPTIADLSTARRVLSVWPSVSMSVNSGHDNCRDERKCRPTTGEQFRWTLACRRHHREILLHSATAYKQLGQSKKPVSAGTKAPHFFIPKELASPGIPHCRRTITPVSGSSTLGSLRPFGFLFT